MESQKGCLEKCSQDPQKSGQCDKNNGVITLPQLKEVQQNLSLEYNIRKNLEEQAKTPISYNEFLNQKWFNNEKDLELAKGGNDDTSVAVRDFFKILKLDMDLGITTGEVIDNLNDHCGEQAELVFNATKALDSFKRSKDVGISEMKNTLRIWESSKIISIDWIDMQEDQKLQQNKWKKSEKKMIRQIKFEEFQEQNGTGDNLIDWFLYNITTMKNYDTLDEELGITQEDRLENDVVSAAVFAKEIQEIKARAKDAKNGTSELCTIIANNDEKINYCFAELEQAQDDLKREENEPWYTYIGKSGRIEKAKRKVEEKKIEYVKAKNVRDSLTNSSDMIVKRESAILEYIHGYLDTKISKNDPKITTIHSEILNGYYSDLLQITNEETKQKKAELIKRIKECVPKVEQDLTIGDNFEQDSKTKLSGQGIVNSIQVVEKYDTMLEAKIIKLEEEIQEVMKEKNASSMNEQMRVGLEEFKKQLDKHNEVTGHLASQKGNVGQIIKMTMQINRPQDLEEVIKDLENVETGVQSMLKNDGQLDGRLQQCDLRDMTAIKKMIKFQEGFMAIEDVKCFSGDTLVRKYEVGGEGMQSKIEDLHVGSLIKADNNNWCTVEYIENVGRDKCAKLGNETFVKNGHIMRFVDYTGKNVDKQFIGDSNYYKECFDIKVVGTYFMTVDHIQCQDGRTIKDRKTMTDQLQNCDSGEIQLNPTVVGRENKQEEKKSQCCRYFRGSLYVIGAILTLGIVVGIYAQCTSCEKVKEGFSNFVEWNY